MNSNILFVGSKKLFRGYKMNRLIGNLLLLIMFSSFAYGRNDISIVNLRCDNMETPVVIESQHPILQWQLVSNQRGKKQSAYRVIVSSSLKLLNQEKGDYWDSVKLVLQNLSLVIRGKGCYLKCNFIGK